MAGEIRLFDRQIASVRRILEECRQRGEPVTVYDISSEARKAPGLAGLTAAGSRASMLLKADTQIELGAPGCKSCAAVLPTSDAAKVVDGRVTHVGRDFSGMLGMHDFAVVLIAAGDSLKEGEWSELSRALLSANRIEGFMARSAEGRFWCRVSRQACRRGFSVAALGVALYQLVKWKIPAVETLELIIVVAVPTAVSKLCQVQAECEKIGRTLTRYRQVDGELYECKASVGCDECPDSEVCDVIREIIVIRKGGRELRLRPGRRSSGDA